LHIFESAQNALVRPLDFFDQFHNVMASDGGNAPRGMVLRPELSTAHDLCDKPVIPSGHAGA